jgi:hypothetical protein
MVYYFWKWTLENTEWAIENEQYKRHWQHSVHKPQDEDKQKQRTKHNILGIPLFSPGMQLHNINNNSWTRKLSHMYDEKYN